MDDVTRKQWKNVAIYMTAKIAIMYGVRYAIVKYANRNLLRAKSESPEESS